MHFAWYFFMHTARGSWTSNMAHYVSVKGPFLLGVSALFWHIKSNLSKPIVGKGASFAKLFQFCTSNGPWALGTWKLDKTWLGSLIGHGFCHGWAIYPKSAKKET
jgi:hypothetical protein